MALIIGYLFNSMESRKISDYEIEITRAVVQPTIEVAKYEREFIEKQIVSIQAQKDEYNAARDAEILECQNILAEMDRLSIVAKHLEVVR